MELFLYVFILAVLVLASWQFFQARAFRARALSLAARLREGPQAAALTGLPAEVLRYASRAGAEPGLGLRVAALGLEGEMRVNGVLRRFEAWQVLALGRAGFLFDASRSFGPWPPDRVVETLIAGDGRVEERRLVSLPLARRKGRATALAAAYRYLADLPWAPDAMIGNPALHWRSQAEGAVLVSLETPAGEARVGYLFNAEGDVVSMAAAGVPDGAGGQCDWKASYSDYAQVGQRRLPQRIEVRTTGPEGGVLRRASLRDMQLSI